MRDYETISVAMTAAETGHLLFSTRTPSEQPIPSTGSSMSFRQTSQHQIAVQLSMVLNAVISQQLVPTVDGQMVPAFEIMSVTPAIRNMIRDNKVHQIDGLIATSAKDDMISMDMSLMNLCKQGIYKGNCADLRIQSGNAEKKAIKINPCFPYSQICQTGKYGLSLL